MGHLFVFTISVIFVLFSKAENAHGSLVDVKGDDEKARCGFDGTHLSTFSGKTREFNSSCLSREYIETSYILTKPCNSDFNFVEVSAINPGTNNIKLKVVLPGATIITAEQIKGWVAVFVNGKREFIPTTLTSNGQQIIISEADVGGAIVIQNKEKDLIYYNPLKQRLGVFPNKPVVTNQLCGLCV